ncbi:TonB-dependent receptor [Flavobacterium sp. Sd200]|uniref:outer membrane beta-barrel family protein n=1 Tax=Flavobacterium sp. Sd200 TaxID=2692211 RepID=UPI00136D667C|nr:outer membrane beta-barrel family protein [Flavobacterium sp. Sd200]MXN91030.1 TonB-dependent receptor [Flavobacterium sp. Sd200]
MGSSSIITTILLLLCMAGFAQGPALTGKVTDKTGQPLAFADVLLLTAQDSVVQKSHTEEDGGFEIKDIANGDYKLKVSTLGFAEHASQVTVNGYTKLPVIMLGEAAKQLSDVVINSKRPIVKRKADRLEFDVENSILSSDNAWEILRKTPGVTIGVNGLSIRGSEGILVTINDKKVYLTGTELRNLLENTNGDDIKSIEVITTPPAKYEAQGSAVLNIKMKKNGKLGYKSSLSGAFEQTRYPKGVLSSNHYYKNEKFSIYGGYMYGSGHYYGTSNGEVRYLDDNGQPESVWKNREVTHYRSTSQNSYNVAADYQIDSLNTVSAGVNGFFSLKSTANVNTSTSIYDAAGDLESGFDTHNHRKYPQKNNTVTATFEHKFNNKNKVSFSSDYTRHHFDQDQRVHSVFALPAADPYRYNTINSDDSRRISLFSSQADYTGEAKGFAIEAGLRYGNVNADNDFLLRNEDTQLPQPTATDNLFLYDEDVFAGYAGAEKEFGKWNLKAGLRGEYTKLKGNSVTTAQINTQDYFKIFPTLYAMYKANDNNQIGVSYGKRIIRPQYSSLNPFRLYATPYSYSTGDPRLQPAISHNFSILYTLNNKYNIDLYYNYRKDPAMEITYQDYATNTTITQFTNIDNNADAGVSFNTSFDIFEWWQLSGQVEGGYRENTFMGPDRQLFTNNKWYGNGNMNNRFNLSKKKDWLAEASFFYQSPVVSGAYEISGMSSLSCNIKKIFADGKAEVALLFSDIYKGQRQTITTNYSNQYSTADLWNDSQTFRIQFRYRFGNQKLQGKAQKEDSEEKSRL